MNRQDLSAFSRDRRRNLYVLGTVLFCLIWMGLLFSYADAISDHLGEEQFIVLAAVPVVALIAVAVGLFLTMPKCPHCGIRLVGFLLATAVASGNCGHCGERIED